MILNLRSMVMDGRIDIPGCLTPFFSSDFVDSNKQFFTNFARILILAWYFFLYNNYISKTMELVSCCSKLSEIECRLGKYSYLSQSNLPGYPDSIVFQFLTKAKKYPQKRLYPNLYHWYILMSQFAPSTICKWVEDKKYYDRDDRLIDFFIQLYSKQEETRAPFKVISASNNFAPQNTPEKGTHKKFVNIEYIISINFKQRNATALQILRGTLHHYDVQFSEVEQTGQININCKSQSSKHQEIANLVTNAIEYEFLQLKKQKKRIKTAHRYRSNGY